jgi:uncharacterized protein (DUF2164 family)
MRVKERMTIDDEKRKMMLSSIKKYFWEEREEDLGDLAAAIILDFFTEKLAPAFYNQGVEDSYKYMTDRVEDLLGLCKY